MHRTTAENVFAAATVKRKRILKRFVTCWNRPYRESGNYAGRPGAATAHMEFPARDLIAGFVNHSPAESR